MPRARDQIVGNLEQLYREAYDRARAAGDEGEMARLDFQFRRDQLYLEAVLDVRDLLAAAPAAGEGGREERSVLDRIQELRSLTRLPFGR